MKLSLIMLSSTLLLTQAAGDIIDYANQDSWGGACQTGTKQSPINIAMPSTTTDFNLTKSSFFEVSNFTLTNAKDKNTIKFEIGGSFKYMLVGKNKTASVVQLHLHWGDSNTMGSEHQLDSKSYPVEMHLVSKYSDGDTEKYAVIGIFFKASANETYKNPAIEAMISSQKTVATGTSVSLNWTDIVTNITKVVTYEGSLTTPDCTEGIYWQVVTEPMSMEIGTTQLEELRTLKLGDGTAAAKSMNYRAIQDLNNRTLTCYKVNMPSAAILSRLSYVLALIVALGQLFR